MIAGEYDSKRKEMPMRNKGFSLIELLVAIAVIATIIGLALPNYLSSRSRARDARRKGEMSNLKTALQLYHNDYKEFPASETSMPYINYVKGCGADGATICPAGCNVDFAAGGSGCDTIYMTKFPGELGSSMFYFSNGTNFCLTVTLENLSDSDLSSSASRCNTTCSPLIGGNLGSTDYAVCSD